MKKVDKLRYPIGNFEYGQTYSLAQTRENIRIIERFPQELRKVLRKIGRSNFGLRYRPGGWTVRQIVHHLADSHMNAFIRMKMALTEPTPVIKPYEQDLWAKTADVTEVAVKVSLRLLTALHRRWVTLLESLTEEDLEKGYFHPERNAVVFLPEAIALYAWHCQHHLAHLRIVEQYVASEQKSSRKAIPSLEVKISETEISPDHPKMTRAEALAKARAARAAKRAALKEQAAQASPERPKMTRAEALAKARAARAAKRAALKEQAAQASPERPKMTRAEALAKARAARAAKRAALKEQPAQASPERPKMTRAEALAKARAARAAKRAALKEQAAQASPERPKMTRAEALAKARAARAAKRAALKEQPAQASPERPKMTRAEALAKARAARAAKR
ncbi:MAG: putative metal-dependent hydrolase, partial [Saprospiraceae bacterium]|nr:putative metal-dependent hydrolase [Saprospiraceae bacterium]MDW8484310.1 putative metal-dependent hydrolase [Saprospiraceae bacterium]